MYISRMVSIRNIFLDQLQFSIILMNNHGILLEVYHFIVFLLLK